VSRRPATPRGRGFTLIEVLVALVIVAFGMGAVLTALTSAADNVTRLREKTFAEWVGLNQLATERLQGTIPATGTKNGDIDFAGTRWHWQETIENMDVPGIKRLTIRVRAAVSATQGSSSKESADKVSWTATVVGFRGDAVQSPLDQLGNWEAGPAEGPGPTAPTP
jgi:general secretion pathway protein I